MLCVVRLNVCPWRNLGSRAGASRGNSTANSILRDATVRALSLTLSVWPTLMPKERSKFHPRVV